MFIYFLLHRQQETPPPPVKPPVVVPPPEPSPGSSRSWANSKPTPPPPKGKCCSSLAPRAHDTDTLRSVWALHFELACIKTTTERAERYLDEQLRSNIAASITTKEEINLNAFNLDS